MSVSESRKVLAGYLGNPRIIWFRSLDGSASVQPPPPPDFALSEPLPGGLQGWLRAVSDMRTCGPVQRRGARRRRQPPEPAEEERPREHGDGSSGPRQDIGAGKNEEKRSRLQNWSEMVQQMATTIFNADGGRLEHQEELSKRWRVATRRKTFSGEESRRQMVVTG